MSKFFVDTFTEFIKSLEIPFTQEGYLYSFPLSKFSILLQPLSNSPNSEVDSAVQCDSLGEEHLSTEYGQTDFLYLYEDRWFYSQELVKKRILARLGRFRSVFARKCTVVAVDGEICREAKSGKKCVLVSDREIKEFIERYHSYGYARSKFRYALVYDGEIVAAAAFSASRPMPREVSVTGGTGGGGERESQEIRIYDSYEWIRYVSLPNVRVVGGMGRLLKAFLNDMTSRREIVCSGVEKNKVRSLNPVEVMSYSDEEWSTGEVYINLGFVEVARREPVLYYVDKCTYKRLSSRQFAKAASDKGPSNNISKFEDSRYYIIKNKGSRKFLLQLP